jgi:Protein of unknown function (DUF4058)
MPLFDHFHGPIGRRRWQSFHSNWAGCIAADLNRRLPKQFVADAPVYLGSATSADVAEYERPNGNGDEAVTVNASGENSGNTVAVMAETYAPPTTALSMPAHFPLEIRVEVRDVSDDYKLLAVVELVSPSNKKAADEREQFAAKCLSYLGKGIGLVVIDIVTERHENLHNELVRIAEHDAKFLMPDDQWIYTTAYRPVRRKKKDLIDLWLWPLVVGTALPAVPLALKGYGCVKLDLEATYTEACQRLRIAD